MEFKDNLGKLRVTLDGKPPRCYWLIKPHRYLSQFVWALALVLVLGGAVRGQTQPKATTQTSRPAQAGSPQDLAQRIWGKLLSHCGDSYFYAGSVFDQSGMLSNLAGRG